MADQPRTQTKHSIIQEGMERLERQVEALEAFVRQVGGEEEAAIPDSAKVCFPSLSNFLAVFPAQLDGMCGRVEKAVTELQTSLF